MTNILRGPRGIIAISNATSSPDEDKELKRIREQWPAGERDRLRISAYTAEDKKHTSKRQRRLENASS